jgi:hypothetical protein
VGGQALGQGGRRRRKRDERDEGERGGAAHVCVCVCVSGLGGRSEVRVERREERGRLENCGGGVRGERVGGAFIHLAARPGRATWFHGPAPSLLPATVPRGTPPPQLPFPPTPPLFTASTRPRSPFLVPLPKMRRKNHHSRIHSQPPWVILLAKPPAGGGGGM